MTPLVERLKLIIQFKVVVGLLYARKRFYEGLGIGRPAGGPLVNVGGGIFLRPHWRVLDFRSPYYPLSRRYIDHDVNLLEAPRFPYDDGTVGFFYSSHTLEHIPQEACSAIIQEMYRCLRVGGAVRLTMPDYDKLHVAAATADADYFASQIARGLTLEQAVVEQIATEQVDKATAAELRRDFETLSPCAFADLYTARASREVQREKGGYHINWFNEEKLSGMLTEAGFATIYLSAPQGSRFAQLRGKGGVLATANLFDTQRRLGIDTSHSERSLFIEAVKC